MNCLKAKWENLNRAAHDPYRMKPWNPVAEKTAFDQCVAMAAKGAKVRISYEDSVAEKTVKMSRVTFAGLLSSLGKIASFCA